MAAAALGNTISDVSGIGLVHYVEAVARKFGLYHPELTDKQVEFLSLIKRWVFHLRWEQNNRFILFFFYHMDLENVKN